MIEKEKEEVEGEAHMTMLVSIYISIEKGEEEQEKVEKGREKGGGGRRDQVLRSSCKILQLYLFPLLRPPHCDSLRCTRGEERARYCHHEGPA